MKFSGKVGFWKGNSETEVSPGVYRSGIIERPYVGDVLEDYRSWSNDEMQNSQFKIGNRITILSDLYARRNWTSIKYVEWNNVKFNVTGVIVGYPKITLEINGGIYNGEGPIKS